MRNGRGNGRVIAGIIAGTLTGIVGVIIHPRVDYSHNCSLRSEHKRLCREALYVADSDGNGIVSDQEALGIYSSLKLPNTGELERDLFEASDEQLKSYISICRGN